MSAKNEQIWKNNLLQLSNFREKNNRLPSNNSKDVKYVGEQKLNSWYKRQLKNYHLKIGMLNIEENYKLFDDFLQRYGYGNKRIVETVNVGGEKIRKTSTIVLDDDGNKQNLTVKIINSEHVGKFIQLLNKALSEDGRQIVNPDTITFGKIKPYGGMGNIDWRGMPEYNFNSDLTDILKIKILLSKAPEKTANLRKLLIFNFNQNITYRTSSIWFPHRPQSLSSGGNIYVDTEKVIPKYPIYIVSYRRHESRLTAKYLEACGIDYKIVIRSDDYDNYSSVIDKDKILVLPDEYSSPDFGSIPARNFVLDHSRKRGDKRHWILDDNINGYYRVNNNKRYKINSGAVFKVIEDYVDRFENVQMAGHNYKFFVVPTKNFPPITMNTRVYSSILLDNKMDFEWRGKYNEDTDLSLRILKKGFPTILFNNIVCDKIATLNMEGGNSEIYKADGVFLKAKSLVDQHPDVVKMGNRFNRIHHIVDYSPFKNNKLIYLADVTVKESVDEYGLILTNDGTSTNEEDDEEIIISDEI